MVVTTMSHEALNIALGKKLTTEEIHNALEDMGMELKSHDEETGDLGVEITPDRLDLISVHGLARALKSFLELTKEPPRYFVQSNDKDNFVVNISKKVKDVRPHTVCAVIKGLKITEENLKEIIDVQEKLHDTLARGRTRGAIGIYPLEKISWPIQYTADKPNDFKFIPLNETIEMTGAQILAEHEMGKEYAYLLEGKNMYPYFVDEAGEILSMPPIINSEKTGRVTLEDTSLFIECSGFDTSVLNQLLNNLVTMFSDMGGKIHSVKLNYEGDESIITPKLQPLERKLTIENVKKRIGIDLSREDIQKHLLKMMYTPVCLDHEVWTLAAPAFRADLWHEVDIIDDIARSYGYNNIELTTPNVVFNGGSLPLSVLREELSDVMVGLGFLENYTFSLAGKKEQLENMNLVSENEKGEKKELVEVVNITNGMESQGMLRVSLLPQQLLSFFYNQKRPIPQKIFEGAFVVLPDESKDVKARNEMRFCGLITDKTVTFTQIKQVLDSLMSTRGLSVSVKTASHPSFMEGRTGEVFLGEKSIGFVGELHPQVLENFSLKNPVAAFEINIEPLVK